MKKTLYAVIIFMVCFISGNVTFAGTQVADTLSNNTPFLSCDQTFENQYLRFGKSYPFGDIFYTDHRTAYINNKWIRFKGHDYVGTNGNIEFTPELKNAGYTIQPNSSMTILATDGGGKWIVDGHPSVRTNSKKGNFDYGMKYMVAYDHSNNYPDTGDDILHNECIYYSITWCGDGVKDNYKDPGGNYINEQCDPTDPNKVGWGTGGCDNSCNAVVAQPVCNSLSVPAPITVVAPASKTLTCTGTNASSIKIDCGNGTVSPNLGGNLTGSKTVNYTCNYTTAKTYTPRCYINNTITNNQCTKPLYVTAPNPKIEIIKEDSNGFDRDGGVYDTQTVVKGDMAMFKIKVKNIGEEDLEYVKITDSIAPNCAGNIAIHPINPKPGVWIDYKIYGAGLHTDSILQPGEIIEYRCKKENTQSSYTNTAGVTARGVSSKGNVNDTDPTEIKVITPTCTSLSATPNAGTVSFTSTFSCTGQHADSYKIVVKNAAGTVVKTIDGATGSYAFTQDGNYTASCYINGTNTTPQACIKPITANKKPVPSITIDKRDANSDDRDKKIGSNDSQTVYKGDAAVFKIRVTNNGEEALKNITLVDAKAAACAGSVTLPNTKPASFTDFTVGGSGNNADAFLQPGEWFEYTCEKANTQEDYTNTAAVSAVGKDTNTGVNATDPTQIKVVEPTCTGLTADKVSGTVSFTSNFNCTGINVDTYKILVKDADGKVIETINSNLAQYTFSTEGKYSVECYMNAETTTESVCKKEIVANKDTNPSIAIDKIDANDNGDLDGTTGNDTQTVGKTDDAVFRIRVTNNGTEDLKNIVLTDAKAAVCAGSVTLPNTKPTGFGNFTVGGAGMNADAVLQPGEWFEYTCAKANTESDYTNSATVNAESVKDDTVVTDTDTTAVKLANYDLALMKKVVNEKAAYKIGDSVEFEITVINQGEITAKDIEITDYIPAGLELTDTSWTKAGDKATRVIGSIAAGEDEDITITFTVTADSGDIVNWAEISKDNGEDCDSTPDSTNQNTTGEKDGTVIDNDVGNGCNSGGDEDDHDPASITVTPYSPKITIEKYSKNPEDLDGTKTHIPADDTQTVVKAGNAVFEIKVTNTGDEDLKDIKVTDILNGEAYTTCDKVIGDLAAGESTEYTCERDDTQESYVNLAKVEGTGIHSDVKVTDEDDTQVVLQPVVLAPAITIEKFSGNTGSGTTDRDGITTGGEGENESQTLMRGSNAVFTIIVRNTGTEDLKDVVVTDILNGEAYANCNRTIGALAIGVPYEYTCNGPATTIDYINKANVTGKGKDSNTSVTDENQTEVKLALIPAIELLKYSNQGALDQDGNQSMDQNDDSQKLNSGEIAKFTIKVTNTGTEDLTDVVVTDTVTGVVCPAAEMTIGNLAVGASKTIACTGPATTADYTNIAKVTGKGKTSNTDVNAEDPTDVVLKTSGGGDGTFMVKIEKYSNQGSNDQDPIKTGGESVNENQKINKGETAKFTIRVENTGSNKLTDVVITDALAPSCNRTAAETKGLYGTDKFETGDSFTYTCTKDNTQSGYTNIASVTAKKLTGETIASDNDDTNSTVVEVASTTTTNPGGGSSSGGGSSLSCTDLEVGTVTNTTDADGNVTGREVDVTCDGKKDRSKVIDCNGNGIYEAGIDIKQDDDYGEFSGTCKYTDQKSYKIACYTARAKESADGNILTSGGYKTSLSCKHLLEGSETAPVCGNGIREAGEQCDGGSMCTTTCETKTVSIVARTCENSVSYFNENPDECQTCSDDDYYQNNKARCDSVTYPSGGEVTFGIRGTALIGHGMNAFENRQVYVKNTGDEPLKFDEKLCVYYDNKIVNPILSNPLEKECADRIIGTLGIGEIKYMKAGDSSSRPEKFIGNKDAIPEGKSESTTRLKISLDKYWDAYFSEPVDVTVAKPTIIARGGGTTYLASNTGTNTIGSVSEVKKALVASSAMTGEDIKDIDQSNFIAAVLGAGGDLSAIGDVDAGLDGQATADGELFTSLANNTVAGTSSTNNQDITNISQFENYKGNENVYYSENADVKLSGANINDTVAKTYIIENGDLYITGDIISSKNIAFIVKGGNIHVGTDVETLDGTYMAIANGADTGKIMSDGSTTNQLTVNGSLYGDINELVQNRTHISYDKNTGEINVGTIVSFGSTLLNKPAPLVSQFIGEYMEGQKVAQ